MLETKFNTNELIETDNAMATAMRQEDFRVAHTVMFWNKSAKVWSTLPLVISNDTLTMWG